MLLPGPLRWVPPRLARPPAPLRRRMAAGWRSFGADSLRRGVDVGRTPAPAAAAARPTAIRSARGCARCAGSPAGADPLQPVADEGDTGLLTGVESLSGFAAVEESDPSRAGPVGARRGRRRRPRPRAEEAGEALPPSYPALTLSRVGKGTSSASDCPSGACGSPPAPEGPAAHAQHRRHPARRPAADPVLMPLLAADTAAATPDAVRVAGDRAGRGARGAAAILARPRAAARARDARRAGAHAGAADARDLEHAAARRRARAPARRARRRRRGGRGGRACRSPSSSRAARGC